MRVRVSSPSLCAREGCSNVAKVKFCGSSCAATHNNRLKPKRQRERTCRMCDTPIVSGVYYCQEHYRGGNLTDKKVQLWLDGTWSGGTDRKLSTVIRRYLLAQADFTCQAKGCGFNTPHPDDGASILEIDHIDGDGTNHAPANLTVLCPNHHALTSTYRARNMGKGRPVYYTRTLRT